jgi:hypothetical protein
VFINASPSLNYIGTFRYINQFASFFLASARRHRRQQAVRRKESGFFTLFILRVRISTPPRLRNALACRHPTKSSSSLLPQTSTSDVLAVLCFAIMSLAQHGGTPIAS